MGIVSGTQPAAGDTLHHEHAAVLAGAIEAHLYIKAPLAGDEANAVDGGAGDIPAGTYTYKYTFAFRNPVTDAIVAETTPSPTDGGSAVTISADRDIDVSGIKAASSVHVNCRRVYRDKDGGGYELVQTLLDNTTTSFTDNAVSTTGQPAPPTANTTGQLIAVDVVSGTTAYEVREEGITKLRIASSGLTSKGPIVDVLDRNTQSFTATNTTALTTLYTLPILAGVMGANGGIRLSLGGAFQFNFAATFTLSVKLGSSTVLTGTSPVLQLSSSLRYWIMNIWIMNSTTTTQLAGFSMLINKKTGGSDTIGWGFIDSVSDLHAAGFGEGSENTTTDSQLEVIFNWSTASTALSISKRWSVLELLPPSF